MGTNYYLVTWDGEKCAHCGRSDRQCRRHIGKSSGGWCFSLRVYPHDGIHDLEDWRPLLETGTIVNEYGEKFTPADMLEEIVDREWNRQFEGRFWYGYDSEEKFHFTNHSERGPNNLLRHQLGNGCVKHGAGTWDCIVGDFS